MPNCPCELRETITPGDVETVRRLVRSSGFFNAVEVLVAVELVRERLAHGEEESGYRFLFADSRGRTAGYACYGPCERQPGWFDLYWLVVEDRLRGRGVGGMLLDAVALRARAEAARGLIVETSGTDLYAPSRGFYEAHGFRVERVVRDHYSLGDDMVVYHLPLAPGGAPATDAPPGAGGASARP